MTKNYPAISIVRARRLRREMTDAELAMWSILREDYGIHRFRRQVPLLHYIVDFASHRSRVVIEVDGGQHSHARDAARDAAITAEGYRTLRSGTTMCSRSVTASSALFTVIWADPCTSIPARHLVPAFPARLIGANKSGTRHPHEPYPHHRARCARA